MTDHVQHITALIAERGIHTVEIGAVDSYGHLRGKRIPAQRFVDSVATAGVNIADAIYVFDIQCEIVDAPTINMSTGYLDMRLACDLASFRLLTHRPGYAIVFADAFNEHGEAHPLDPRGALRRQVERLAGLGFDARMATELEAYVFRSDWSPFQQHVQYSSLTDALELEAVVADMRLALLGAGIPVEGSNPEYGPGQLEINVGPADPLTTADNTVLFKTIVKQVAWQHGLRASFMPKPFTGQSGSGMHLHSSLVVDGANVFGHADGGLPNQPLAKWTAGLLANASAMSLIGIPTPNGYRRVRPYTFCPTHVHWGEDNRTVLARLTMNAAAANRVEFRSAGADANPYLALASVLAAGCDGMERALPLPPMAVGDMYTEPGDSPALPTDLQSAIDAFDGSPLALSLGAALSENLVVLARNELAIATPILVGDPDEVTGWERARYLEHT